MADHQEVYVNPLSYLSMKTIIGYMDPEKLLEVAIETDGFQKFGETIKVSIYAMLVVVNSPLNHSIGFSTGIRWSYFEMIEPEPMASSLRRTLINGRINGVPMELHKTYGKLRKYRMPCLQYRPRSVHYRTEVFSFIEMEDATSHVLRHFTPEQFDLCLTASPSTFDCFVWKISWKKINFYCNSNYIITWEDLRIVLEHETATDVYLEFEFSIDDDSNKGNGIDDEERKPKPIDLEVMSHLRASFLDIPKLIKCKEFRCNAFDFISVDDLINSQCTFITLRNEVTPMTNSEVNKLLKAWQKGEHMQNLEDFTIEDYNNTSFKHTAEIMAGIDLHDEDPLHPSSMSNYRFEKECFRRDGEEVYVIKRETDNALASIVIENDYVSVMVRKNSEEPVE